MREHTEEPGSTLNEDSATMLEENEEYHQATEESSSAAEEEGHAAQQEFSSEYYRDVLINVRDQVETSKLVLQLVTDSRFNMTQVNGQRKLGGPPPGWQGPPPGPGCEVFVGKIPRNLYEHEIYPIFRRMGEVYEIRLMMDFSGTNRGYCFVMFGKPEFAQRAINELDNFEIRPGRRIGVVASINNCRLYVGQLPSDVKSEIVIKKIYDITDDVGQVSVYRNSNDHARYALISYKTHRGAAMARRRLVPDRASLFGGAEVSIDWAHPSMFPSNVVEDTGVCDDQGNLKISRLIIGSENKRCQNRQRARDDFLDHSIRAYLQSDRALEQIPRNYTHNQNFNNCLSNIARGINNFHLFDQNSDSSFQNYFNQRNNFRATMNICRSEVPGKSKDANSSFDLNGCSSSLESSSPCSSSPSSVSTLNNFITPSSFNTQIFYPVNNGDICSDQVKVGGQNIGEKSVEQPDDEEMQKNYLESLNLFDNYTFFENSHDKENQADVEAIQDTLNNDVRKVIQRDDEFLPKIRKASNAKRGTKVGRTNDQKVKQQRNRNSVFANRDNNNSDYKFSQKSMKNISKSSNVDNIETFPKTVGAPLKNLPTKCDRKLANVEIDRNFHIGDKNYEENYRQSSSNVPFLNRSQIVRNGICSLFSKKNYLTHQQLEDRVAYSNQRHFSNCNMNFTAKKAWLSAQIALNSNEFSSGNLASCTVNVSPNLFSNTRNSLSAGEHFTPGTSAPVFIPQHNLTAMNFYPDQNSFRNQKLHTAKIVPKSVGRPILSRSHIGDEN